MVMIPLKLVRLRPRWAPFVVVVALLASVGCGGVGDVSGKVTVNGKPLSIGAVTFVAPDGLPYTANVKDGEYATTAIPTGTSKVLVTTSSPPRKIQAKAPHDPRMVSKPIAPISPPPGVQAIHLPAAYDDPEKTPLEFVVKRGPSTFDIAVNFNPKK